MNTSSLDAVDRRKLSEIVYEKLLFYIETKQLKPGDRLPSEKELMERFNVARSVVREATQSLNRVGLVKIKQGEKPIIVKPSLDDIANQMVESISYLVKFSDTTLTHLKEIRKLFEVGVVKIAAEKRNEQDVIDLRKILHEHQESFNNPKAKLDSYDGLIEYDVLFHKRIAQISHNPIYETFTNAFFNWISFSHSEAGFSTEVEKNTIKEHHHILDAIESRDVDLAEKYMGEHLESSRLFSESYFSIKK